MSSAIKIENLVKKYEGGFTLGGINIDIPEGIIVGLIGENGAGKTTLVKSILNILKIDEGNISIFGKDMNSYEDEIKEDIGIVLDDIFFPEVLLIKDLDSVFTGVYKNWDSSLFDKYLVDFKLDKNSKIKKLSKGMRKKLEIACALAHKPKLLILDEPTSGLDPIVRNEVLDIFLKFISDDEHTILLSTHITSDLEHIADNIIFINDGKVLLEDSRDNILEQYAIIKCDKEYLNSIDKKDIVSYKKNKYDCEVLIKNQSLARKKYKDCVIDKITIEELMIMMIKGER